MTIPDIPIPPTFEATHTTRISAAEVQVVATCGGGALVAYENGVVGCFPLDSLTPLPPPLPKARVGWYLLNTRGELVWANTPDTGWTNTLKTAWANFDRTPGFYWAVVKLCADGVLRHVDRDGVEGAPLEVEQ